MQRLIMFSYAHQLITLAAGLFTLPQHHPRCKPIPGDAQWPSPDVWTKLNFSLNGRLLTLPPPGAVCHPTQSTFNPVTCPIVASQWHLNSFHAANSISNTLNNWNNDSCLPFPGLPCTGDGYPRYVVDARSAEDVKKGIVFARRTGLRLIVKGTGHDYLGR